MSKISINRTVDHLGFCCPMPVLEKRIELDKTNNCKVLELLTEDPTAESGIQYLAGVAGQELLKMEKRGSRLGS
jgi:TusA-related sulfurtransferase